ncbi:HNH endonuclease [Pantoea sp. Pa-EAmG]|uniref:HNH endonuclease n=1 Tax=Pantoea sp. Pa-EAmG TaxID=3043311 RepID=UPI0024AFEE41|nr:HNH endonuclease [Pantoea sp. Pa-EAmG]MDI6955844.1 HNH endonuclease [Pantoea sp. Pa-EAmG]
MRLSKNKREALAQKFGGCCAYCGETLPVRGWHAEFIDEKYVSGGMVAVCTDCRESKGNASPEAFRILLAEQVNRAQRHSINFRNALRFGLVCQVTKPVQFWFERYPFAKTSVSRSSAAHSNGVSQSA